MADLEVRQLEIGLARSPDDLETRQRLLAAYVRIGILQKSDLIELAALGDPGAIALTGKTPNLDSRSRRFYLRCAWGCLNEVYKLLDPDALDHNLTVVSQYIQSYHMVPTQIPALYKEPMAAMAAFNDLFVRFLNKEIKTSDETPIPSWRPNRPPYSLERFEYVFNDLHNMLGGVTRSMPDIRDPDYDAAVADRHATVEHLLWGYCHLCMAFSKKVKAETDEAIYFAATSLDRVRGVNYHLNRILQGQYSIPFDYYNHQARLLLQESRSAIIAQWLPNYTFWP